jgi:hypothetical protein
MTTSNTPSAGVVGQVTAAVADSDNPVELDENGQLRPETVNAVIAAYDAFRLGAEPGTKMQNPDTGALAIRVDDPERGAVWKTISSGGEIGYDTQPSLPAPWTSL